MLRKHPHFWAYWALAAVCFFWGTTYLGIRMALEAFPPVMLVCLRFLISGAMLLTALRLRGMKLPQGRELWLTALFGAMTLGIGTGGLVFAEGWIPSGLAAVFITTSPFWMVGVEALLPGGVSLHGPTISGMLVGLLGTVLLVLPSVLHESLNGPVMLGFLVLQLSCCGWAFGSIWQRRHKTTVHPVMSGAVQQFATGAAYLLPMLLLPQAPVRWSARGVWALLYLVVFGSIVGYSAYIYVLENLPVSLVSIYTYINPLVAVFLGWLFYREAVGWREVLAMLIVFLGVAIVKRQTPAAPLPASPDAEPQHTSA